MRPRNLAALTAASVFVGAWLFTACKDKPQTETSPPAASEAASVAASASATAPPKQAPWYIGTWSGTYEAQHYLIERTKQQGAVAAWAKDEGELGSGQGKLTLKVDENRQVSGSATGALGALEAMGEIDGETLRVQLSPKDPKARPANESFAGTLVGTRKGEVIEGRIQASTGDSLTVRDAAIRLEKARTAPADAGRHE